ncbi:MAG TPA: transposase [Opitutaceae bacterium]|nr:transposase [Opitutaceae bacterium]
MKPGPGAERRGRRVDGAFKRRAVELTQRDPRSVGEIARELGLSADQLYRWRAELGAADRRGAPPGPVRPRTVAEVEQENQELRAKLAEMEERELILKKSLGILSPPTRGMPKSKP